MSLDSDIANRIVLAKTVQTNAKALVKAVDDLCALDAKIYMNLKGPDAMFHDSPLSPLRTVIYLRRYLAKLGFSWATMLSNGPEEVKPFVDEVKASSAWPLRFQKTQGIDQLV